MRITSLMTVDELEIRLNDEPPPTVIDVRAPEIYALGHLPTAINIPANMLRSTIDEIPLDRPVIVYCNMHHPGQSSSESVAETLREAGFHARALKGGFPEWKENGKRVEAGSTTETEGLKQNRRSRQGDR